MSLSEDDRDRVEAFLTYVEDTNAADERYGPTHREERDGLLYVPRFEVGTASWLEVAVDVGSPHVRVGFATSDEELHGELADFIAESAASPSAFVRDGFENAGLRWEDPPVEEGFDEAAGHYYSTTLDIEELIDLENDLVRNKTLRMLEGYLIAFGPGILVAEDDDWEGDWEDEEP